jgi:hypothetical protein
MRTEFAATPPSFMVHNLLVCFEALDGTKAPRVEGVTKEM